MGVTRHLQIVRISKKIVIYDTPGVIPFDHPDQELQTFLGAISIDDLKDPLNTAFFFLDRIKNHHSTGLINRYQLSSIDMDNESIISHIANQRGMLLKGGQLNMIEAAKVLMREFVSGLIPYWEEQI